MRFLGDCFCCTWAALPRRGGSSPRAKLEEAELLRIRCW